MSRALVRGSIVWVHLDPTRGREQQGNRPALVVASDDYLASVRDLVIVVPLSSVDRGWIHHVPVEGEATGLRKLSFAMTEQPRTITIERIVRQSGKADDQTMFAVDAWLRDFMAL